MALTDMKVPPEAYDSVPSNPYGYGLCINLTEEQVEALGLDMNTPRAGSAVGGRFVAQVTQVIEEADVDGDDDNDVRMSLQITSLEITPEGAQSSSSGTTLVGSLYGGDND